MSFSDNARRRIELSMPYLMDITYVPTWAKTEEGNAEHLQGLKSKNLKVIARFKALGKEWDVFSTKDIDVEEIWIEHGGLIKYHVEVEKFELVLPNHRHKTVGQTSVWRDKSFGKIPGIAKFVFNQLLFPKFRSIITDDRQSDDGKNFWSYRIQEALDDGLFVYGIEGYEKPAIMVEDIKQIVDSDLIDDYYTTGIDFDGEFRRILITDKPLTL